MASLNRINRINLPVGYFKRIVNSPNNPNLRRRCLDANRSSELEKVRVRKCVPTTAIEDRFSILKVDSTLVDKKNLNKYLKKVMNRDYANHQLSYLLGYIVNNMSGSLDCGNLVTIFVIMARLEMRDGLLLDAILPLMYKMDDFSRITDCLLYGSMIFGSNDGLRMFALKLIHDLPRYSNYFTYNSLAKLCEALCHLRLYSEEFGNLMASFVGEDTLSSNQLDMTNFSSILIYLSRVGVGGESAWKLYLRYSLDNAVSSGHKVILKLLQSCVHRNVYNKELFRACGDSLARFIDIMHPIEVASASYYYFRVDFKHDELFSRIFRVGERVVTSLDSKSSLKLLSGYHMYFSSSSDSPLLSAQPGDDPLNHGRLYRTVYLIYNNISTSLNCLDFEEFLLLFKTLGTFTFISTRNLQVSILIFSYVSAFPLFAPNHVTFIFNRFLTNLYTYRGI